MEWAVDARGRTPASGFDERLGQADRVRLAAMFQWLARAGSISNRERFKFVGFVRGQQLFEFKSRDVRFFGAFRPGQRFLIAPGTIKKRSRLRPEALEVAARILTENDLRGAP